MIGLDEIRSLREAVLTDIPDVARVIDTQKMSMDDQHLLGHAAVIRGNSLVGWHVADSSAVIRQILKKKGSLMKGYGPRGRTAELGPGLYVSAVPSMWVNRASDKWGFLKDISSKKLLGLVRALNKEIRGQHKSGHISDSEFKYALRDLESAKKLNYADMLVRFASQPFNISFWKERFLKKIGIDAAANMPIEVELHLKGKFAGIDSGKAPRQTLRMLRRAGVDGAFIAGGFVGIPQLVVWNPRAVVKIGKEQRVAE